MTRPPLVDDDDWEGCQENKVKLQDESEYLIHAPLRFPGAHHACTLAVKSMMQLGGQGPHGPPLILLYIKVRALRHHSCADILLPSQLAPLFD